MITAAEARKKVNERKLNFIQGELSLIEKKIDEAIYSKRTFCLINFKISDSTQKDLKKLGYIITISNAVPSMGITEQTRIDW